MRICITALVAITVILFLAPALVADEEIAACNELLTDAGCEEGLEPYAIEPGGGAGGSGRLVFLVCRNPNCPEQEDCLCEEQFVPEPSSLVLLLSGLAGMAIYRMRSKSKLN